MTRIAGLTPTLIINSHKNMQPFPQLMVEHGLDLEADERSVKRAYAKELKKIDQEADPAGFQSLRESYEYALAWLKHRDWQRIQVDNDDSIVGNSDQPALGERTTQTVEVNEASPISSVLDPALHAERTDQVSVSDASILATPNELAQAVFALMLDRIKTENGPALDVLQAVLDDSRLLHIEARDIFEWHVASYLASGWRAENRDLLAAAITCFQWNKDSQRLMRFGPLGKYIDRAMVEIAVFEQLDMKSADYQLSLIRKLRDDARPTDQYLIINLHLLEVMVRQYPCWLPMITSKKNIDQWREWGKTLDWNQQLPAVFQEKKPRFHFNTGINRSWIIFAVWILFQIVIHIGPVISGYFSQYTTQSSPKIVPQVSTDNEPVTPEEMFIRGEDHLFGRDRLKLDVNLTVHYWTISAERGDAEAQMRLGLLYYEGKKIPQNYEQSLRWLLMAAKQGDALAQSYVAQQYKLGMGTPVDETQSKYWSLKAEKAGFTSAKVRP